MRLSEEQIKRIKKLSKEGESLRHISKELGINLTTIYYYTRKIHGKRFISFNPISWNPIEIGEVIGAFAGDGSYYNSKYGRASHHICRFHFNKQEMDYVNSIYSVLKRASLNPFLIMQKNKNGVDVKINSKEFASYVKGYLEWEGIKAHSVHLKPELLKGNPDFLVGFAIGLMRSDGSVKKNLITFISTSRLLRDNLSDILNFLSIDHCCYISRDNRSNRKDRYHLRIYARSIERFFKFYNMGLLGFEPKSDAPHAPMLDQATP